MSDNNHQLQPLTAVSPIDGRYHARTENLADYFSEFALIRYRVIVEVNYFLSLCEVLPQLEGIRHEDRTGIQEISSIFSLRNAARIKEIERTTNHDVKAVEYFIKEKLAEIGLGAYSEFVHFGLTSQDVNNTAIPLSIKEFLLVYKKKTTAIRDYIAALAHDWAIIPMLARTHGQPASPTLLGKEMMVFVERLDAQLRQLNAVPMSAKFGGATGNFNAHHVAYPSINWVDFGNEFVATLGLTRSQHTTQIEHYDNIAALLHASARINTILTDFCRDMWTYISMDYFKQKTKAGEVGSSAMPHKVNPIDFENAEGNFGIANALFEHLAAKLPVSRLQRDLTDSTVLRNIGVPFAHTIIAFYSVERGIDKLLLNATKLHADLDDNWAVVAEAIQTILRREQYPQPYEALKALTRGKSSVTKNDIHEFISTLNIPETVKMELQAITPHNYTGIGL